MTPSAITKTFTIMKIEELIWLTHGMEMQNVIQSISDSEWSSVDDFMDIVDIETSTLLTSLYVDDTFNEYDEAQIQTAVLEIIEEYINMDYSKE